MDQTCLKCGVTKDILDFPKNSTYTIGYSSKCKACRKEINAIRYIQNKEIASQKGKEYWAKNKEKRNEYKRNFYLNNKDKVAARNSAWKSLNKHRTAASRAKYRATLKNATPKWLTEDQWDEIINLYKQAKYMSDTTGIKHHVDHIEPLKGETSTGLHVPWNLQILKHFENESKSNKLILN